MQHQLLLAPRDIASTDKILVDATWFMPNLVPPKSGFAEWKLRRLPGARFLDLDAVAAPNELGLKHMMPSGEVFAKACGKWDCN
jgi:thiosulfate/3-mercaptopyruvate sulfurtransferase